MADYDVTEAGADFQITTCDAFNGSLARVDDTHVLCAYADDGPDLEVRILTVNDATWAITAEASLELDGTAGAYPLIVKIDDTHFLVMWKGTDSDGFCQIVTVNTGTWAVTKEGSALEFDAGEYDSGDACLIDTQNVIIVYRGVDHDGFAVMVQVNLSTWAVTKPGSALEFYNADVQTSSLSCFKIDGTHIIVFWGDSALDGRVRVLSVNTGTGAITAEDSEFEFDTTQGKYNSCYQIDSNHFVNFWMGTDDDGFAQVFTVNLGTWAVTKEGTALEFDTTQGEYNACYQVNTNHFINIWAGDGDDGYAQCFAVNTSTWAVTVNGTKIEFKDASVFEFSDIVELDSYGDFMITWQNNNTEGLAQILNVEGITPDVATFLLNMMR